MSRLYQSFVFIALFLLYSVSGNAQDSSVRYDSLLTEGRLLLSGNDFKQAVLPLQDAFDLALQSRDTSLILESGYDLGRAILRSGQYKSALNFYLSLENKYYSAASPKKKALINYQIAWSYDFLGEYSQAIGFYKKALALNESISDSAGIGLVSRSIANDLLHTGAYDEALNYAKKSLRYISPKDSSSLSYSYQTIYVTYLFLGQYSEAEPYLLKACEIGEDLNNKTLLNDCYFYLGDYYTNQNNYHSAINYFQKGLALAEDVNDFLNIARYYKYLGITYLNAEDPVRALSYFNQSLNYYESNGNDVLAAEIKSRIASCYRKTGDTDKAEELLKEALGFYQNSDYPYLEGSMLLALADLNIETGNDEKAIEYLNRSTMVGETHNDFWIKENSLTRYLRLSDTFVSSVEKLELSKRLYRSSLSQTPDRLLSAMINLSKAFHSAESDSAFYYAEKSLELIEKKRVSFTGETLKAGLFADYVDFYNEVGSWYATEKADYRKAFSLFESSKARSLMDQLVQSQQENLKISNSEQTKLLEVQKQTDLLYRQLEEADSEDERISIQEEISRAEFEYDALLEMIRRNNVEWSRFAYPEVLSLRELQELCDEGTAVIEYAFTYESLSIMLITENDVYFTEVHSDNGIRKEIKTLTENFREQLTNKASFEQLRLSSEPLYQHLLAPLADHLEGFAKLIIVPDRSIAHLPFDALMDPRGRFLVERFAIKMMPSVSVYDLLPSPHRDTEKELLALAGSGFDAGDGLFSSQSQATFAALPYTLIEVDSISSHFTSYMTLRDEEVTEATLKEIPLEKYQYIHFATHGAINEVSPSQSGLILSKKIQVESLFGEDGFLNASEISQLRLNADMVVLSACNTATGKILTGEGLLGLQRAFLTAGASSVVASLWSIYDRSTPVFMGHFYRHLKENEKEELGMVNRFLIWADWYEPELVDYKTLALQEAKLEMLDHPYYNHPVHWASFIITGK